ncbi:MAG: M42 family metallopeptidase, partial [Chloroflexota bacterium]
MNGTERDRRLELLERLSNCFGVSGFEDDVRSLVLEEVEPYIDAYEIDPLGNLIVTKHGHSEHTVMLDAHIDEIGFMVTYVEESGFLRFAQTSGWDLRIVPAHRITIRSENGVDITGVIGTKPPHILSAEERSRTFRQDDLFIDIGASDDRQVAAVGVRVGSPAVIHYPFEQLNANTVTGKALDNRAGCAVAIEALRQLEGETPELTLKVAFTVREEVGLLGATTAAYQVNPDIALVLEGTIGADTPGVPSNKRITRLGAGPAITVMDGSQIVRPEMVRLLEKLGSDHGIPHHLKLPPIGGTDGGAIQRSRGGVLSGTLSVPCRYIHSPVSIMRLEDLDHTIDLTTAFIRKCGTLLP